MVRYFIKAIGGSICHHDIGFRGGLEINIVGTDAESAVIVNEAALRDIGWPEGSQRQVRVGDTVYEVIGVVNRKASDWGVTYNPEFWAGRELAYPHVPKEHAKFARTQVAGNLVIVSGCQALDHDTVKVETMDFKEQSDIVLEKIKIGMEETGGSLASVVKTVVFLKDLSLLSVYRDAERAFCQ